METYYSILGVKRDATAAEIKTAYLSLIRQVHPDALPNASAFWKAQAEQKTKELNEAYAVLSNPAKRHLYDSQLDYYQKQQQQSRQTQTAASNQQAAAAPGTVPYTQRRSRPPWATRTPGPVLLQNQMAGMMAAMLSIGLIAVLAILVFAANIRDQSNPGPTPLWQAEKTYPPSPDDWTDIYFDNRATHRLESEDCYGFVRIPSTGQITRPFCASSEATLLQPAVVNTSVAAKDQVQHVQYKSAKRVTLWHHR
jgi:curved DNA-binding protein CbpA